MEKTIFERIIAGEIPSYKIYEDDKVYAMLDIEPLSDGHVLVIPKKPVDVLWDLDNETYDYLWKIARQLAQKMQDTLHPERVGVVVEGFGVPHAHIHLVPLYDNNVLQLHHDYPVKKSAEDLVEIAEKIKL